MENTDYIMILKLNLKGYIKKHILDLYKHFTKDIEILKNIK
jgi:hypothetical protein